MKGIVTYYEQLPDGSYLASSRHGSIDADGASQSQVDYIKQLNHIQADLAAQRDEARRWARRLYAENAALRREREITASVINQNYALTKECDMLQDELDALRHLRQKKQVRANG